jgi:protein subunit release factor B
MDRGRETYKRPTIKNEVDADDYANQVGASSGPGGQKVDTEN